jgi:hypothetical protein
MIAVAKIAWKKVRLKSDPPMGFPVRPKGTGIPSNSLGAIASSIAKPIAAAQRPAKASLAYFAIKAGHRAILERPRI